MNKGKQVQIISCGPGLSQISSVYGHSFDWVTEMIKDKVPDIKIVKIYDNEVPSFELNSIWIITGSRYSVYDDIDWISSFKEYIVKGVSSKIPMLGICFGHQIICNAIGGTVVKNNLGWEIGSSKVLLTKKGLKSKIFKGLDTEFSVYQSHQDIVKDLPESATVLAYNKYGVQSFSLDDFIFGVQFHPEFKFDVMKAYYSIRTKKINTKKKYSIYNKNDGAIIVDNFIDMILRR